MIIDETKNPADTILEQMQTYVSVPCVIQNPTPDYLTAEALRLLERRLRAHQSFAKTYNAVVHPYIVQDILDAQKRTESMQVACKHRYTTTEHSPYLICVKCQHMVEK